MYCKCGFDKREMILLQEQQDWQDVGETVYYFHCRVCGRNHVPKSEQEKLKKKPLTSRGLID